MPIETEEADEASRFHAQVDLTLDDCAMLPQETVLSLEKVAPQFHVDVIVHCDAPHIDALVKDVTLHVHTGKPDSKQQVEPGTAQAEQPGKGLVVNAVIAMSSRVPQAERVLRSVIVSLDAIPGNQVDGISPLYQASSLEGPDATCSVVQISSHLRPNALSDTLSSLEASHEGAVTLQLVDANDSGHGDASDAQWAEQETAWSHASKTASVLAPWLDMDPQAHLGKEPVSYLLAMAPDAERVGLLSENWIIGETA